MTPEEREARFKEDLYFLSMDLYFKWWVVREFVFGLIRRFR